MFTSRLSHFTFSLANFNFGASSKDHTTSVYAAKDRSIRSKHSWTSAISDFDLQLVSSSNIGSIFLRRRTPLTDFRNNFDKKTAVTQNLDSTSQNFNYHRIVLFFFAEKGYAAGHATKINRKFYLQKSLPRKG